MRRTLLTILALLLVTLTTAWADADLVIYSTADWNTFASNVNNGTDSYQGKTVKLAADITVSTMVGDENQLFKGTFDGCGYTLTLDNLSYSGSDGFCAPFRYVDGATFTYLHTAGTVTAGSETDNNLNKFCAGLIGRSVGTVTITNCRSSVTINSSLSGDGTHGGFIGVMAEGTINMTNCLFDGKMLGANTNSCGGFVGWRSWGALNITNCVFAPEELTVSASNSATFSRNRATLTNCFYKVALGDTQETTAIGTTSSSDLSSALGNGWDVRNGNVVPKMVNNSDATIDTGIVIYSTADWNTFADNVNNGADSYQGKTVKLAADITVSTMVGDKSHPFQGTFDGCGYTLTLDNLSYSGSDGFCAPFRYVDGATFTYLHTAGTVIAGSETGNSLNKFCAGLIGRSVGTVTITNCINSVTINSSLSGDGTHGGFIGVMAEGTVNITNCLFDGKMLGENTHSCGGFVGWRTDGALNITNCVFAPEELTVSASNSATFSRNWATLTKCFYKVALGDTQEATEIGTMSSSDLSSSLGKGWSVRNGNVVPKMVNNPEMMDISYRAYNASTHDYKTLTANNFIAVTSSTTMMGTDDTESWYAVREGVTVSDRITVRGTVHLILCDGKTLTASEGITVSEGNTFIIYGQSGGTGSLVSIVSNGDNNNAGIGSIGNSNDCGTINIHGGIVTAVGGYWSAGIGGGVNQGGGTVNIYGGTVIATENGGNAEAIGQGSSGTPATKTIADRLCVTVNDNSTPVSYGDRVSSLSQKTAKIEPCTNHNFSNDICTYCGGLHNVHVTYNGNDATSGTAPTDATIYDTNSAVTVLGNTDNLVRTGYTFIGWNTAQDGSGVDYAPGAKFTIYSNISLYAQWTPVTYTVRFHKNDGGEDVYTDQTLTYDAEQTLTNNAFTREDWLFAGWNTETSGTVTYTDGQSVCNLATVKDAVVDLYALWVQNIYTITYDLDGGTVATPNPTTYSELSSDITLVNPTRMDYYFSGWTGTDLTEASMSVTIPSGSTGNRSYTANWKKGTVYDEYNTATGYYETHFFSDDITSVTSSTTTMGTDDTEKWYVVRDDVTVSDRITVRGTVHLILCDGKKLTASEGITVSEGNTFNLYGQSGGTGSLVSTVSNGESAGIGSVGNSNYCGTINIHGGIVTAVGGHWSAGIGGGVNRGGGTVNIYGGTVNSTGLDGNAHAIGQGSSGLDAAKTIADGLRVTVNDDPTPVAYGDRVSSLSQKTATIEPCTKHNFNDDVCTYCGRLRYVHVTYNGYLATSGTAPTDATVYETGSAVTILDNTGNLTRTNYNFIGWNTVEDGSGTNFAPGAKFTIYGNITLYAQWTPITYTVRFHKNDGLEDVYTDQTLTYGTAQALTPNAFTREDWYFAGWNTETSGTVTYTDGQSVCNLATVQDAVVDLYALWVRSIYTITYDLNGGTVATPNPTIYSELSSDITLVNPTHKDSSFSGWTGTDLTEATLKVTIPSGSTGNRSYTANWKKETDYYAYNTATELFEMRISPDNITSVTSSTTTMGTDDTETWYAVRDDVTVIDRITVSGTVHLILCDDKTLTASDGITVNEGNTLNIYAQNDGTGSLVCTVSNSESAGIGSIGNSKDFGTINIHGGIVTAVGGHWSAGIGGGVNRGGGTVNIYGGTVNATGFDGNAQAIGRGSSGRNAERTIADGLRVTVNDNPNPVAYGDRMSSLSEKVVKVEPCTEHDFNDNICTYCGCLHHYYVTYNDNNATSGTAPTDAIDYKKGQTVTILGNTGNLERTGYTFGGWNTQADGLGTDYAPDESIPIGRLLTLYAKWEVRQLELADNDDNSDNIDTAAGDGMYYNVTLSGRTLYRDGDWNTLCLPFNMDNFIDTPLEGATVMELDIDGTYNGRKTGFDGTTLNLNFRSVESIAAGHPYIVKWMDDQTPVINPSYEYVNALDFITEVPTFDDGQPSNWNVNGEGPAKLVDGNLNTKYGMDRAAPWVEFHYASAITPKGYALWTANDTNGARNPVSWTIKAKNSGDADWTTLTTVDNSNDDKLPLANYKRTVFALANNKAYQYFRFEAPYVGSYKGFQLAELQFCTVKPTTMSEIENPIFGPMYIDDTAPTAVTSADGMVSFVGSYNPVNIAGEDRSILFLGAANTLRYPNSAMQIGSCRAHFELKNGLTMDDPSSGVRTLVLNFGEGEDDADSIGTMLNEKGQMINDNWYDLSGRKLGGKPNKGGIYIHNGMKVAIK